MVGRDGRPRVADFGLARTELPTGLAAAGAGAAPGGELASQRSSPLSLDGHLVGTPAYMAPEQYRGQGADARSDQYSFCVALHEALYRSLPFGGDTLAELAANVLAGRRRPLGGSSDAHSVGEPSDSVAAAVERGLSLDPAARFPSMADLLAALSLDPRHSPAAGSHLRRRFSFGVLFSLIFMVVFIQIMSHSGRLSLGKVAVGGTIVYSIMIGLAILQRKSLAQNSFQRGMVAIFLCAMGSAVSLRWAGFRLGLSLQQIVPLDLLAIGFVIALGAYRFMRAGWVAAGICIACALLCLAWPLHSLQIMLIAYPLVVGSVIVGWARIARRSHG